MSNLIIIDASAVLALLLNEPTAMKVLDATAGARLISPAYEIRQVKAVLQSPLDVAGLAEFHQTLKSQPPVTIDSILDDIEAGRQRQL